MTREKQSQLLGEFYAEKKNVLKLKGEDYANEDVLSNFKTAGANIGISAELQCLSLIATKVARLGNLLAGKTPNNESVSDSILDLSNYTDLLYCLVNEEKSNQKSAIIEIMKQDEKDGLYDEPKTKRWENVKPINLENFSNTPNGFDILNNKNKPIIYQINWTDINDPIKKAYEPKVGDIFENLNHAEYEIIEIIKNKITLKNKYGLRIYKLIELQEYLNRGHLKKIN